MTVFGFEFVRTTRGGRLALWRTLYALALLIALGSVYDRWFPGRLAPERLFDPGTPLLPSQMARFAEEFTTTALMVQLGAVLLLTPALTAGAIAEERQRGTLDLLLTTHLTPGEVVLGKFGARLAQPFGVLLAGLPILALTPLWGGVDPGRVLAGFVVCAATAFSLAAAGLFFSTQAKTVRGAAAATYAVAFGWCTCTFCVPLAQWVNPLYVLGEVVLDASMLSPAIPVFLFFCGVQIAAGLLLLVGATVRVAGPESAAWERAWEEYQQELARGRAGVPQRTPPPRPAGALSVRAWPPPPVGGRPLVWKELYVGHQLMTELAIPLGIIVLINVVVVGFLFMIGSLGGLRSDASAMHDAHFAMRGATAVLLALAVITAALPTALSLGRERERKTLDPLLTLPGGRDELLAAKWLGGVLHPRWFLGSAALAWIIGAFAGVLHPLAVPVLVAAAAAHVGFFVSLALWLSVATRDGGRALFLTVLALVLSVAVPPLVGPHAAVWSPPAAWWAAAAATRSALPVDVDRIRDWSIWLGLVAYAGGGWLLWRLARRRFRREANG